MKKKLMALAMAAALAVTGLAVPVFASESGKTLKFAIASECEPLDPGVCGYLQSSSVLMNIFMGLYMTGEDGKTLVNGCAESYDMSEDGLTYTFHLYDDLLWSDGTPLTAADFEYAWKRVLAPELASTCSVNLYVIKNAEAYNTGKCSEDEVGVKALDDTTLEVVLENPTSYFLDITAEVCYSPVKKDAAESSDTWSQNADTVALDEVDVVFISEGSATLTVLKNGEIEHLPDVRVRKALSTSIDRETITQNLIASKPKPAKGYVPEGLSYYGSEDDFRTVVGDLITYDPEGAKALLDEAVADGFDADATYTLMIKNEDEMKTIAQAMWKANLGLNFEITTYESGTYWDEHTNGSFDVAFDGWTGDYDDPNTMLECLLQSECATQNRWSGELAEQYDAMIKECAAMTDQDARFAKFAEAEKFLIEESPIMPLYYRKSQLLVGENVESITNDTLSHTLFKYAKVK